MPSRRSSAAASSMSTLLPLRRPAGGGASCAPNAAYGSTPPSTPQPLVPPLQTYTRS